MVISLLFIALGVFLVSYGAKILVDGASSIAKRLRISDLVIGLTIVSFGTSAPELIVSTTAALQGKTDVALGNVLGSNILNICLILGISALITPLYIQRSTVWKEIPLSLLGILVVFIMASDIALDQSTQSVISRSDGWVLLCFFLVYLAYMIDVALRGQNDAEPENAIIAMPVWKALLMVAGGILGLTYGGTCIVDSAIDIARTIGVSESLIGLTLVSVGTSIPELATSIAAARQRNADIAVGNVVGSNIFNTFFILGSSAAIAPLPLGTIGRVDFAVAIASSLLLFAFCFLFDKGAVARTEGALLLLLYAAYMAFLIF